MNCSRCGRKTYAVEQWCSVHGSQVDTQDERPYVGQASALPSLPKVMPREMGAFVEAIPHAKQVFLLLKVGAA